MVASQVVTLRYRAGVAMSYLPAVTKSYKVGELLGGTNRSICCLDRSQKKGR